ncbi:hypothetical protein [Embleya hyalina]|uniref:ABM domain-containing protein n=1 Tax=Embleya hyalina TaxID=516124 RepID=A0A401YJ48_9ACTN|nr:hypothetical protein [Embleya hyalina]GCD94633.1 hypothetical protein EHYA_02302 [Embleya hyalina]
MTVLVYNKGVSWTRELYQTAFDRIMPDRSKPPAGLVVHIGAPLPDGGWQVIDVWETEAQFRDFMRDVVAPVAQEIGAPPFETKVMEVHNLLIP